MNTPSTIRIWIQSTLTVVLLLMACALARAESVQQIIIPESANPDEQAAARLLSRELAKVTGKDLPILAESRRVPGSAIAIGQTTLAAKTVTAEQLKPLGVEGFVARRSGADLLLIGSTPRGDTNAVLAYLEHLGFRWLSRGETWTVIPDHRNEIELDDWHLTDHPAFLGREIWPIPDNESADVFFDWYLHARLGGGSLGMFGGSNYCMFCDPTKYFATHPEYFALVDGTRHNSADSYQLCVSNPQVQALALEYARQQLDANSRQVIPISPNDGAGGFCQCDACKAIGSPSDQALFLANTVARGLRTSQPEAHVGLYAYADAEVPPHIDAEPNVVVYVVTACHMNGHTTDELIAGWRPHVKNLGIRDYEGILPWDWMMPRDSAHALQKPLQSYLKAGAIAWNTETSDDRGGDGFNQYVISKLLWNPYADVDALLDDWCQTGFRRAAAPMRHYVKSFAHGMQTGDDAALAMRSLQEAYRLEDDPRVVQRLDCLAAYLHYVQLFRAAGRVEDVASPEQKAALTKLCRYLVDIWPIHAVNSARMVQTYLPLPGFTAAEREKLWTTPNVPTHEQIVRMLEEDLAATVPFNAAAWVGPWSALRPMSAEKASGWTSTLPIRYGTKFAFWATKDQPVQLTISGYKIFPYEDPIRVRVLDLNGKEVAARTTEINHPATLKLNLAEGLYRVEFVPNSHAGRIQIQGAPAAVLADPDDLMCVIGDNSSPPMSLWVPKSTLRIGFTFHSSGGGLALTVRDPDGKVVLSRSGQMAAGDCAAVDVPPDQSGRFWQVTFFGSTAYLGVWGVPPLLVQDSSNVLIDSAATTTTGVTP